jgi:hypothetical protein
MRVFHLAKLLLFFPFWGLCLKARPSILSTRSEHSVLRRKAMHYRIHIQGHLDPGWQSRFPGLRIEPQETGTTLLSGYLSDQLALYGVLLQFIRLGLTLLSLETSEASGLGGSLIVMAVALLLGLLSSLLVSRTSRTPHQEVTAQQM